MERKLLLLGLLRQQHMHGYQLFEFIDRALAVCTDIKKPTAYYMLNKMAEDGLISEQEVQEGNRPPRRVYSLTAEGEAEYQRLLEENLSAYTPAYFPSDTGLAFLDDLPRHEALGLLAARRERLAEMLRQAEAAPAHAGSLELVIEHQRRHLRAELEFLDDIMARYGGPLERPSTLDLKEK